MQTSATASEWLEWVSCAVLRRKIKHRTAALFFGLVWDYRSWGLAFALGGGRMHTGGIGEYHLSSAVAAVCAGIIFMRGPESGFLPFFRNWPELCRAGLVDGAEWRAHRFEWF